ncbi:MAG: hypothetical protein ACO3RU_16280, partial [Planctomycetota bacterium]
MSLRAPSLLVLSLVTAASPSISAQGQTLRAELAWRTRALEVAGMAVTDADVRAAALPDIEEAVQKFFRLDGAGVAEALDDARARLAGRKAGHDPLDAVQVHPTKRLIAASGREVQLAFGWMYGEPPEETVPLTVHCGETQLEGPSSWNGSEAPLTFRWPSASEQPRGDVTLDVRCGDPGVARAVTLSIAPDLDRRLDDLDAGVEGLPQDFAPRERRPLAARLKLL